MTTFEKAMTGDTRAIERYFFTASGATRSDEESRIIFNMKLEYREKLRRIAVLREAKTLTMRPRKAVRSPSTPISFELLISQADAIHARSFGIRLN